MRRLSMRNKRKSEATSEDESEENGVNNSGTTGKSNKTARRSVTKRRPTPRVATDDNAETKNLSTASDEPEKERENGEKKTATNQKSSTNKRKKKEDKAASTSSRDKSSAEDDEYEVRILVYLCIGCIRQKLAFSKLLPKYLSKIFTSVSEVLFLDVLSRIGIYQTTIIINLLSIVFTTTCSHCFYSSLFINCSL